MEIFAQLCSILVTQMCATLLIVIIDTIHLLLLHRCAFEVCIHSATCCRTMMVLQGRCKKQRSLPAAPT